MRRAELKKKIEETRKKMIECGLDKNKGLLHEETIKLSQALDDLLNQAM